MQQVLELVDAGMAGAKAAEEKNTDKVLEEGDPPYYHPGPKSEELEYMRAGRRPLDGPCPELAPAVRELHRARHRH